MLTIEQLKERRKGIGASDAAAICGVSKFRTPLQVYLDKISEEEPVVVHNPVFERGHVLEPIILRAFQKKMDMSVGMGLETIYHPDHPFIFANLDGILLSSGQACAVVEAKTSSIWTKDFHLGEVPDDYFCQVQHQMACSGLQKGYVVALCGDEKYFSLLMKLIRYVDPLVVMNASMSYILAEVLVDDIEMFEVERDDNFIERMIEVQKDFWENNVLKKIPPESMKSSDSLLLFPKGITFKSKVSSDAIRDNVFKRIERSKAIKAIEKERDILDKDIMEYMGDASILLDQDGEPLARWQNQLRKVLDTMRVKNEAPDIYNRFIKQGESRVFRVIDKFL